MENSQNINDKKEKIEELSSVAGGSMELSPSHGDETQLRELIKKSIKLYSKQKNKPKKANLQEEKLRKVIQLLIKEAKQSSFPRPQTTLEGILSKFFNSSGIYQTVRDQFYDLQTDREEKTGFIKTFLERSNEAMMAPSADAVEGSDELKEEEAEEPETSSREKDILDKWGAFVPSEVDDDLKKIKVKLDKSKSQDKKSKKPEDEQIESFEKRGANSAREVFEQRVQDELKKIMLKLIGEEKEQARILIMQNFTAWFDMWTDDSEEMDKFLINCLNQANVPIPPQFKEPEPELDSEETDLVPDDDSGEEIVDGDEDTGKSEEDLFELLDSDLS